MSGSPASEASVRIAAEELALRRSPLDPLRAVAAAECAGLEASEAERELLGELLERLTDPALATATLAGDGEGAARLATLVLADAIATGAERLLWVGPRPRAVDRLCERCAVRQIAVRNERGAYDGAGLFCVDELESAPPGLRQAEPFDRVVATETPDPPWRGPTLTLGGDEALLAPAVDRPAPAAWIHALSPAAVAVDEVLSEELHALEPGLGPLARAAARGSTSNRAATLRRLETRLGRMVRSAHAGRSDDGAETARQLASDRDQITGRLLAEALDADEAHAVDVDGLEAERARLAALRDALEREPDPVVETLAERALAALAEGEGVALVLPGRGTRDALATSLDALAGAADVEERLDEARRGPSVALLGLAEHEAQRLDPVSLAGLRVLAHHLAPIPAAHELVGEGEPTATEAEAERERAAHPARTRWERWRAALGLEVPTAHPDGRAAIAAARTRPATPWTIAHLVRSEGEALLVVGDARDDGDTFTTLAEAGFAGELALLRVARRRLERSLAAARRRARRAQDAVRARERSTRQRIEEAERRKARASGADARREANQELAEAKRALEPLRKEAAAIDEAHRADRRSALDRFAERASLRDSEPDAPSSSHPRERLQG